jgi:hypothetical protein
LTPIDLDYCLPWYSTESDCVVEHHTDRLKLGQREKFVGCIVDLRLDFVFVPMVNRHRAVGGERKAKLVEDSNLSRHASSTALLALLGRYKSAVRTAFEPVAFSVA